MNNLLIFITKLILGIVFGIIIVRVFKPDWTIYHGIATGVILACLSYLLPLLNKK